MIRTGGIIFFIIVVELHHELGVWKHHPGNLVYPQRMGKIDQIILWWLIARIQHMRGGTSVQAEWTEDEVGEDRDSVRSSSGQNYCTAFRRNMK